MRPIVFGRKRYAGDDESLDKSNIGAIESACTNADSADLVIGMALYVQAMDKHGRLRRE